MLEVDSHDIVVAGYNYFSLPKFIFFRLGPNGTMKWSHQWPKIGISGNTHLAAVAMSPSKHFFLGGRFDTSLHPGVRNIVAFLMKTDSNGVRLWTRMHAGNQSASQEIWDLRPAEDGGVYACGMGNKETTIPDYNYGEDACLWKFDSAGTLVWERRFGMPKPGASVRVHDTDCFFSMDRTIDGGFILAGQLRSGPVTDDSTISAYLVKTDANGAMQWERSYRFERTNWFTQVRQSRSGGYILVGKTMTRDRLPTRVRAQYDFLMKTDSLGFVDGVTEARDPQPDIFALETPTPHPLRAGSAAVVRYRLDRPASARLALYDALGRERGVFAQGEADAGKHTVSFDTDGLSPGLYFMRLSTQFAATVRPVILVR